MSDKFLDKAYGLETPEATLDHYNQWAASYDAEIADNGYATPGRIAAALAEVQPDMSEPVLDFGCGTGLSGLALRRQGFEIVDGMDPSADMLDQARSKSAYRKLTAISVSDSAPIPRGSYRRITGCGVLGTGAAPPEVFDMILHALPRGGLFAFSYNDHALADPAYTGKLIEWVDVGAARLLFQEHGDHLPGINLKSTVYVIEKA
ncbi:class I SAM-dependent DNA methyltransferase [Phaeobacter gallaeciensis]|uniref:Methyltransferase domain protein n=1 Tax=Phaeobacter gallaeciensis TaxID=60890 RepID=A0AAD0ED28_9RHOB|nr:methyltransferase domain-containing protein [Phaeobacter gallaeciensis]AHD09711.1 Methyltransferase domain protein [Phaeobacter gallaeciensis DSM 26640]ATE92975.1 Methyltransferase domain protein [Phaeobacter gallaeciensis]ATE97203.1 Methyltransferase domain protein [Phaeobacter gallaeciensis]ATF01640.1 Methyltransferase domain protein [Phaeobacter gallaeciensis]ATF06020.1 Methyltransferase domain protein [Phaeobacter gallaeciensis]